MLFPIIKVKDNDYNTIRIVGTSIHDRLYIDDKTGGIQYLNLQCNCNTNKSEKETTFKFIGEENKFDSNLQIEFVSFRELKSIYLKENHHQISSSIKITRNIINKIKNKDLDLRDYKSFNIAVDCLEELLSKLINE